MPSSCAWRARPSAPVSPKPAERTTSARTPAVAQARAASSTAGGGDGDDGQLHRSGHLGQRRVCRSAGDRLGVRVDRVERATKASGHQVAEHRPADAALPARRADDRDRGRLQDMTHGGDRRGPIALLEALARRGGELCGKLDLQQPGLGTDVHGEPGVAQHGQHAVVARMDDRRQRHDPGRLGELRQMREHQRADPASLPRVGHREGQLGPLVLRLGHEAGMGDDVAPSTPAVATRPTPRSMRPRAARPARCPRRGSETSARRPTGHPERPPPRRRRPRRRGAHGPWSRRAGRRPWRRRAARASSRARRAAEDRRAWRSSSFGGAPPCAPGLGAYAPRGALGIRGEPQPVGGPPR